MNDSIQNMPTLPQKRSRLRLSAGRWYFTGRRYLDWIRSDQQYVNTIQPATRLPYKVISHHNSCISAPIANHIFPDHPTTSAG